MRLGTGETHGKGASGGECWPADDRPRVVVEDGLGARTPPHARRAATRAPRSGRSWQTAAGC